MYKNLTDPVCPPEYETVTGTFMGTKDYCVYLVADYTVGRCPRKSGLYTVEGIDPLSFNKFQNQILCAKRDKELDYHQLALERDSRSCPSTSGCGSDNDANKRFCFKNSVNQCPPNSLLTYYSNDTNNFESPKQLAADWMVSLNLKN